MWKPIETAPKDGTVVLARFGFTDTPTTVVFDDGEWTNAWDGKRFSCYETRPVKWMPIPTDTSSNYVVAPK